MLTPLEPVTAAAVADEAADLLETDGWCQDRALDDQGRFCLLGAIQVAAVRHNRGYAAAAEPICAAIVDELDLDADGKAYHQTRCMEWNDHPERTATDVVDALRHSAKRLRAGA